MSALLHTSLKKHLAGALASLKLAGQSENGDVVVAPQVFIGDTPPKRRNTPERLAREIPCVVIIPLTGHSKVDNASVETKSVIALACVVYSPEEGDMEGAEADLANLLSAVTGALLPCSQGEPLARRFVLETDEKGRILPWVKADEQSRPFLQATMTSQWTFKCWE